jgi:hypothetical protein
MEITVEPGISERVLALATNELRRMEAANDAWHGAYISMKVVDGNTSGWRVSGGVQTVGKIPRDFPKGHWMVCLQPAIPRAGKITIMAFSKDNLALVYFGSVNAPD